MFDVFQKSVGGSRRITRTCTARGGNLSGPRTSTTCRCRGGPAGGTSYLGARWAATGSPMSPTLRTFVACSCKSPTTSLRLSSPTWYGRRSMFFSLLLNLVLQTRGNYRVTVVVEYLGWVHGLIQSRPQHTAAALHRLRPATRGRRDREGEPPDWSSFHSGSLSPSVSLSL